MSKDSAAPGRESIVSALAGYERALERLRYGSFRGVVKAGKLIVFAIEQEWRTNREGKQEMR